jgi:putative nucleotidyltransferase with HDIG domain
LFIGIYFPHLREKHILRFNFFPAMPIEREIMETLVMPAPVMRVSQERIESQLETCARLPSLSTINNVLHELLHAEQCYTSQVSDVIRRDPSMTTRLLRLVNSVYFGLSAPVTNIEEAVFYLGVRQIRQLAMVTPVIEDLQKLTNQLPFPWREFWQHCIATAILTREIIGDVLPAVDEVDYISGLLHDVGKIVMISAFPKHFTEIQRTLSQGAVDLLAAESEILGLDHCELGALYLKQHKLPEAVVEAVRCHHHPCLATRYGRVVAAVQIADLLVRHAHIGNSGNPKDVSEDDWLLAEGWEILFPGQADKEKKIARANLKRSLDRLPTIMDGLV